MLPRCWAEDGTVNNLFGCTCMDQLHYQEMKENLETLLASGVLSKKDVYLFGHCNATEELADLLMAKGCRVWAILDNNPAKQGGSYQGIPIIPPQAILEQDVLFRAQIAGARLPERHALQDARKGMDSMVICIASRAYEAMVRQLRQMGYSGRIEKLVDYNTFAEYSLSQETISRKKERVLRGIRILEKIRRRYDQYFCILCPFAALGDVYYAMAYLPGYLENNHIKNYVVITVGRACADVVAMFGCEDRETLNQKDMDELVQAVLFTGARDAFIAHHDKPYPNLLMRALYVKRIPFELLYRCGVFGMEKDRGPSCPNVLRPFLGCDSMVKERSVIISPYAKSVAGIDSGVWNQIISHFRKMGFEVFTNIAGEEKPLAGTRTLRTCLMELKAAVEWAGTFIGVRSGLCDVIKDAACRKIVLFPDCYYSDTRWKVAEFFHLEGWENIVVKAGSCNGSMEELHGE